jgi:hypothetical protein
MSLIQRFTLIFLALILSACGAGQVVQNPNSNALTVTAKNGLLTGGWNQSTVDATDKAVAHCSALGQKYFFLNESRTGSPGWTPLESTITFRCGADNAQLIKETQDQCKEEMKNPELDPIKAKVELYRSINEGSVPFEIATNNTFPTAKEKSAIAKWAKIRESCVSRSTGFMSDAAKVGTPLQNSFIEQEISFSRQIQARVGELIVALYQGKLTYGEFSQKRYEMVENIASAERAYRAATLQSDRDIQIQGQQAAQQAQLQQQQNNLIAWQTYMQSVNARQPQTVRLQSNCTTSRIGNTASTNCY